jgi:hypothetical protein
VSDEQPDQPLTGKAKRLANLIPYKKGQSGNKSGRPKNLAKFGDILMKEFYKTVVANMGTQEAIRAPSPPAARTAPGSRRPQSVDNLVP